MALPSIARTPREIWGHRTKALAPLVGGSDLSYRLLCRKYGNIQIFKAPDFFSGAEVTYTEMCVSSYFLENLATSKPTKKDRVFEFDPSDRPLILQLAGKEPDPIIKMANLDMFKGHIDMVDLNCGCPQNAAMEAGYGAALLAKGDHLVDMCKQIVRLVEDVPSTIQLLQRLQDVGVKAFTIHGRFHWQKGPRRGLADWDAIGYLFLASQAFNLSSEIRKAMPNAFVIGNGDILQYSDIQKMMEKTRVDAIMAGYGGLLNPSLFGPKEIPLSEVLVDFMTIARAHRNKWVDVQRISSCEFTIDAKGHVCWMIKKYLTPELKTLFFETQDFEDLCKFLSALNPPLKVELPPLKEGETNKIILPLKPEDMTPRQLKNAAVKRMKRERKRVKRENKPAKNLDSIDDLVAG